MPSEKLFEEIRVWDAVSLISWEGEELKLIKKVTLDDTMENWLNEIQKVSKRSLEDEFSNLLADLTTGVNPDEWALKYCTQCCAVGLLVAWTMECEQGINELKTERRALTSSAKKFAGFAGKLVQLQSSGKIVGREMASITYNQKIRLDTLISVCLPLFKFKQIISLFLL